MRAASRAPGGPRRLVVAALCLCAVLAAPPAAGAAVVPSGMFGMQDWQPPTSAMMAPVAAAGVHRWRTPILWPKVQPTAGGAYDWSRYDRIATASALARMPVLFVFVDCPAWACPTLSGPPSTAAGRQAQRDFVTAAVARYGTGGAFWSEHPELSPQPVTAWQVGNEVNFPGYWYPRPSAAEYAAYLQGDAAAIRAADPTAQVVLSGLSDVAPADAAGFLAQLYAQPGFRSSFDVLAVHTYGRDVRSVAETLDRVRAVEVANGDAARRMWVTEIGWGTSSAALATPTTEWQQAVRLGQSFEMAVGCAARWNLDRMYWFAYQDITPAAAAQADNAGLHTGLLRVGGAPKLAWTALLGYAAGTVLSNVTGCPIPPHEPSALAAPAPSRAGYAALAAGHRRAPQTLIYSRRRLRGKRRALIAFASRTPLARFQCRLRRSGARTPRWKRCASRYRTPRLRRGRYRLQARAVVHGLADPTPAVASIRLARGVLRVSPRAR